MKTKKDELASLIAAHCGDAFFVQMSDNYGTFQQRIYADDMAQTLIDAGVEEVFGNMTDDTTTATGTPDSYKIIRAAEPIAYIQCLLCGEPLYLYDLSDSYRGHTPEVCQACKDLWAELKAQKQR